MRALGEVVSRVNKGRSTPATFSSPLPKVVLVGAADVDARLAFMRAVRGSVDVVALGSGPAPRAKFLAEGFGYASYSLSGRPNPILDLRTLGQLMRIFTRLKPNIVHAFDTKPGVWGCLAARLAGVPAVVGTVTGLGVLYANEGWKIGLIRRAYQPLQRLACRVSDETVFQNHEDLRHFVAAGIVSAEKAIIIPGSGVATRVFDRARIPLGEQIRAREELGIRCGEIVVTMIARVIRSKGVHEFAAAARDIHRIRPEVRFVLVGSAEDDSVDRLSQRELLELRDAVTCSGYRRDVPAVLAISDIFVLPSALREGIPRILLEAASIGLPIVTTDSPGCNQVVEHDMNGFLVPVRDSAALREAILRLIEYPQLRARFGSRSRQRAIERFEISVIARQTMAVYQRLLARKGLSCRTGQRPAETS